MPYWFRARGVPRVRHFDAESRNRFCTTSSDAKFTADKARQIVLRHTILGSALEVSQNRLTTSPDANPPKTAPGNTTRPGVFHCPHQENGVPVAQKISVQQVAEQYGVSTRTVWRYISEGTDSMATAYLHADQHLRALGLTPAPVLLEMQALWRRGTHDRELVTEIAEAWELAR
jgi:hypothetical protein